MCSVRSFAELWRLIALKESTQLEINKIKRAWDLVNGIFEDSKSIFWWSNEAEIEDKSIYDFFSKNSNVSKYAVPFCKKTRLQSFIIILFFVTIFDTDLTFLYIFYFIIMRISRTEGFRNIFHHLVPKNLCCQNIRSLTRMKTVHCLNQLPSFTPLSFLRHGWIILSEVIPKTRSVFLSSCQKTILTKASY